MCIYFFIMFINTAIITTAANSAITDNDNNDESIELIYSTLP